MGCVGLTKKVHLYCYYYYYYYFYLYLLYIGYSLVCRRDNVPMGYTVAPTLSFYCQYGVWRLSPSFLRWL